MNELAISVLRRARYEADIALISKRFVKPLEISENEFNAFIKDAHLWAKSFTFAIEGVPIKVKWNG